MFFLIQIQALSLYIIQLTMKIHGNSVRYRVKCSCEEIWELLQLQLILTLVFVALTTTQTFSL